VGILDWEKLEDKVASLLLSVKRIEDILQRLEEQGRRVELILDGLIENAGPLSGLGEIGVYEDWPLRVSGAESTREGLDSTGRGSPKGEVYLVLSTYGVIRALTERLDSEVLGLLKAREVDSKLVIYDVVVIEQWASSGYCEATKSGVLELHNLEPDEMEDVKGWWHSHCLMSPFLSGIDRGFISEIGATSGYVISLVSGKEPFRMEAWIDFYKPIRLGPLPVDLRILLPEEMEEEIENTLKKVGTSRGWGSGRRAKT